MERRLIPFLGDAKYSIDRDGHVYSLESRQQGRARTITEWTRCNPITLSRARSLARVSLNYLAPLVEETSEIVLRLYADGHTAETVVPYTTAHHVRHDPATPMEPHPVHGDAMRSGCEWGGGSPRLVGDREHGWYRVQTKSGIVHLFHGTSTAAEIFHLNH